MERAITFLMATLVVILILAHVNIGTKYDALKTAYEAVQAENTVLVGQNQRLDAAVIDATKAIVEAREAIVQCKADLAKPKRCPFRHIRIFDKENP